MSDDLKRIYNHCDPYKPAADDFYLDCSAARGGGMVSQEFIRRLQLADDHLSFLFAGHIGCGKSSEYSGGQTRGLLTFVQSACAYSPQLPIRLQAVQRAAQQAVRTYSTSIPHHHWQKLAELDLSENRFIPGGDPDFLTMLENLSVLEYINGGEDDPFAAAEPWYAVNPIVRELGQFKAARSGLCKVKSP